MRTPFQVDLAEATMTTLIEFPSGSTTPDPEERLGAVCAGEYMYYDAIVSTEPNRIEPFDVLATVAVNSFVYSAAKLYRVHQGLRAACEPLLPAMPEDADLLDLDRWRNPLQRLLHRRRRCDADVRSDHRMESRRHDSPRRTRFSTPHYREDLTTRATLRPSAFSAFYANGFQEKW